MKRGSEIVLGERIRWRAGSGIRSIPDGEYTIGIRPHHITPTSPRKDAETIEGRVLVAELSGSESVIHFDMNGRTWVSQSHGIHPFQVGQTARLYVDVDHSFFFGADQALIGGSA